MILTIIVFLLVLSILVLFHEFGHFYSARKLGIKVDEFGLGFPPRFFSFYKNNENKWKIKWGKGKIDDNSDVIYSINAIPVGGFVKIKGENGDERQDKDSFASQKIWKRLVVISAGVFMNVILAWFLISIGLMIGFPQAIDDNLPLSKKAIVSEQRVQIVQIIPGSPADSSGLKAMDVVLRVNEKEVPSSSALSPMVIGLSSVNLEIERDGEIKNFLLDPKFDDDLGKNIIGVSLSDTGTVRYPWYLAFWEGIKTTLNLLWMIIYTFYVVIKNLIFGQAVGVEVAGPVGIANLTGQMARMGIIYLLQFTALLSLNLAVINFLPFPALDGGRFIFLLIEKIKGKPVKQEVEAIIHNSGFLLLMALVVWVTLKDVIGLFR